MTDTPNPPEGWYPDPAGSGSLRRWNGAGWTEELRPSTSSPDTGSTDAAPVEATDRATDPGEPSSPVHDSAPSGGLSGDGAPGDSAPGGTAPGDTAPGDTAPRDSASADGARVAPADAAAPTTDARRDATAAWDTAAEDAAGEYDGAGAPLSRADRTVPVAAPPAPPAPPAYSSAPFSAGAATAAAGTHVHDSAASPAGYPAYPGSPAAPPAAAAPRRDVNTDTIWIWLAVAMPLLTVLSLFLFDWRTFIDESVYSSLYPEAAPRMLSSTVGITLGFTALSLVLTGLTVLFSFLDWRELRSRGIERPFHWAWSFFLLLISTNGVYVIGRGIVLRRQTGKGLGPVWAWIAVTVVSIVIASVWAFILLGYLFELLGRAGLLY